jgi:hypothetical protein
MAEMILRKHGSGTSSQLEDREAAFMAEAASWKAESSVKIEQMKAREAAK